MAGTSEQLATPAAQDSRAVRFLDRFAPAAWDWSALPEDRKRQVRNGIGFIFASLLMTAVFIPANFKQGNAFAAWWEVGVFAALSTLPVALRRSGRLVLVGNICMFGGVSSIFWACWYSGGLEAPPLLILMIVPTWAYLGYGKGTAAAWSVIGAAIVVFLYVAERKGWVPPPSGSPEKLQAKRVAEGVLTLGFAYLASRLSTDIKDYAVRMLQQRSGELKQMHDRLENLFDSMTQGVLTFGPDGRVDPGMSSRARTILGEDLGGRAVVDVLFHGQEDTTGLKESFEFFQELVFDAPPEDWPELVSAAPTQLTRLDATGEAQHLVLEFCPVRDAAGRLERVMLLVTDDTERVRMERAAKAQSEAHQRQVDELRRMVAGGAHLVLQFLEVSRRRLEEVRGGLFGGGTITASDVALALAHVHTIRGEARTFQLVELSQRCAAIEDVLAPLRAKGASADGLQVPGSLREDLAHCETLLEQARDHLTSLSPVGEAVLDQITVRKSHVRRLADLVERLGDTDEEVRRAVQALASRPFGESAQRLPVAIAEWAAANSKRVEVVVEGRDRPVPPALSAVLGGVLGHLARNAVAHGIEPPQARRAQGKPERARVRLACEALDDGVRVIVEDDGAGLDEAKLRSAAAKLGLPADAPLSDILFSPGLSTASDAGEIAGRGMGMIAVRNELSGVGYDLNVLSKPGCGTRVELHPAHAGSSAQGQTTSWRVA